MLTPSWRWIQVNDDSSNNKYNNISRVHSGRHCSIHFTYINLLICQQPHKVVHNKPTFTKNWGSETVNFPRPRRRWRSLDAKLWCMAPKFMPLRTHLLLKTTPIERWGHWSMRRLNILSKVTVNTWWCYDFTRGILLQNLGVLTIMFCHFWWNCVDPSQLHTSMILFLSTDYI